jgi:hypothetical protein
MLNTPNQTHTTVQDVIEYLDDLLCKMSNLPLENDFELGHERAFNDVMHHLLDATADPECCSCSKYALSHASTSNTADQTLATVQEAVDCLFDALRKTKLCALENEFHLGYEGALNYLTDKVRAASLRSETALNARDDNREIRMTNGRDEDELSYEMIETALQELAADGQVYDTGERRWSERRQSYEVVWGAVPPKHKQH